MYDEPFDFHEPVIDPGDSRAAAGARRRHKIAVVHGLALGIPVAVSIWLLLFAVARAFAA